MRRARAVVASTVLAAMLAAGSAMPLPAWSQTTDLLRYQRTLDQMLPLFQLLQP